MNEAFYFGCIRRAGHYFFGPDLQAIYSFTNPVPWTEVDGKLSPHAPGCKGKYSCKCLWSEEGRAILHHKEGWTALSFWDRSVDSRGGCNSSFFFKGNFTFGEMVDMANKHFPVVMGRFNFQITDVTPGAEPGEAGC